MIDLLGVARVQKSLHEIAERLSSLAGMIHDHAVLGKEAHALVSLTGVLGFTALAEACRGSKKHARQIENLMLRWLRSGHLPLYAYMQRPISLHSGMKVHFGPAGWLIFG